jgi:hypothetical protein
MWSRHLACWKNQADETPAHYLVFLSASACAAREGCSGKSVCGLCDDWGKRRGFSGWGKFVASRAIGDKSLHGMNLRQRIQS